jgi:hypothetical protein
MMAEALRNFIFSLSVAFPAIAGLIRFRKVGFSYRPFLIYLFVSLLNELLEGLLVIPNSRKGKVIDYNLFNLFEAVILLSQFYYWGHFERYKKIFPALLIAVVCGWLFENFIAYDIYHFNAVFLVSYSFILVLLSVQNINHIIANQSRLPLIKNPIFIICVTMIVFFIYNIFVYTLLAKGIANDNKKLVLQVFGIQVYINALANILYGIAVCFIPSKNTNKNLFMDLITKDFANEQF